MNYEQPAASAAEQPSESDDNTTLGEYLKRIEEQKQVNANQFESKQFRDERRKQAAARDKLNISTPRRFLGAATDRFRKADNKILTTEKEIAREEAFRMNKLIDRGHKEGVAYTETMNTVAAERGEFDHHDKEELRSIEQKRVRIMRTAEEMRRAAEEGDLRKVMELMGEDLGYLYVATHHNTTIPNVESVILSRHDVEELEEQLKEEVFAIAEEYFGGLLANEGKYIRRSTFEDIDTLLNYIHIFDPERRLRSLLERSKELKEQVVDALVQILAYSRDLSSKDFLRMLSSVSNPELCLITAKEFFERADVQKIIGSDYRSGDLLNLFKKKTKKA